MWKHKNFINLQLCAGETWVLNESPTLLQYAKQFDISFTSNNTSYTYLKFGEDSIGIAQALYYGTTQVYEDGNNAWTNTAYRTITFDTPPTGDLLTWLQANGTKQSTPTLTFKHFYDAGLQGTGTYKFRHYSQQEPSSGETWVLNETFDSGGVENTFTTSFVSNGTTYASLSYGSNPRDHINYGETNVYFNGTWTNTAYRTITFATAPTGDLLTWLQANGVKQ